MMTVEADFEFANIPFASMNFLLSWKLITFGMLGLLFHWLLNQSIFREQISSCLIRQECPANWLPKGANYFDRSRPKRGGKRLHWWTMALSKYICTLHHIVADSPAIDIACLVQRVLFCSLIGQCIFHTSRFAWMSHLSSARTGLLSIAQKWFLNQTVYCQQTVSWSQSAAAMAGCSDEVRGLGVRTSTFTKKSLTYSRTEVLYQFYSSCRNRRKFQDIVDDCTAVQP